MGETGVLLHLRHVLVRELEPVDSERLDAGLLVDGDQLLAAAGIARDAKHDGGRIGAHDAGVDQRPQQRDGAGRVAARIGDAVGVEQLLALVLGQLRKAVGPAVGHAIRRRGVDHDRVGIADGGHQFLGRRVGQAQHGDVGRLGDLGALAQVLAVGQRQFEQFDVRPVLEPVEDLQPGGAVLAVDENFGLVRGHWSSFSGTQGLGKRADWRRRKVGSRLIFSSGFTIRRDCYARAISHRFSKQRRRDRREAQEIIAADISPGGRDVKRTRRRHTGVSFHRHPAFEFTISSSLVLALPTI